MCAQPADLPSTNTPRRHMIYNEGPVTEKVDSDTLRFVTILDLHLSPVTPASRKDDFYESTKDSFRQAVKFAVKMNARALIMAGDILHLKTGSRNPHWFMRAVQLLLKEAQKAGVDVLAIAGNHDLTFGSMVSFETQPIGVLAAGNAVHLLDDSSVLYEANGFTLRIAGSSFNHSQASPVRDLKKDGATFLVSVGHFWFGQETGEFFGEPVYGPTYFSSSEADAFVIGHHHADQGIPQVDGRLYFAHGSINRIGAHAGDMVRRPAVGLLEVTKSGITGKIARLKVPDANDIFDLVQHQELLKEKEELNNFMEMLNSQVIKGDEVQDILKELQLTAAVRTRVDAYLKTAEEQAAK